MTRNTRLFLANANRRCRQSLLKMPSWVFLILVMNVAFWIISNLIKTKEILSSKNGEQNSPIIINGDDKNDNNNLVIMMQENISKLVGNLEEERNMLRDQVSIIQQHMDAIRQETRSSSFDLKSNKRTSTLIPGSSIVFITDIAGFIGYHLTLKLISMDIKVIGIDNLITLRDSEHNMKLHRIRNLKKSKYTENILEIQYGNVTDKGYLNYTFCQYNITHIVYLSNYDESGHGHSSWSYFDRNTQSLINLFESILTVYNNKLHHYSDITIIYGSSGNRDIDYDFDFQNKMDIYSINRLTNEMLLKHYHDQFGLKITELRFYAIYGICGTSYDFYFKFTDTLFLTLSKKLFQESENIPIRIPYSIDKTLNLVHIDDIINGIISSLNLGYNYAIFNLGSYKLTYIKDIANQIKKKKKLLLLQDIVDIDLQYKSSKSKQTKLGNISLALQYLNYSPSTTVQFGIEEFINWYNNEWYPIAQYRYGKKKSLLLNCMLDPATVPELENYWNHNRKIKANISLISDYYHTFKEKFDDLRDMKYLIDIVIFTDGISWKEQISNPEYHDIIFLNINYDYRFNNFRAYNDARFIWWSKYLLQFKSVYKYVLITDLFDVKFGRNPFEYINNTIGDNESLVISGTEDSSERYGFQWRDYIHKTMKQCYGASVWFGSDLVTHKFMYNPGSGIAGYTHSISLVLQDMVNVEMPYVIDKMCDANMVQYAKSMWKLDRDGNITVLDLSDWNSPFKAEQDYKEGKYVIYHK